MDSVPVQYAPEGFISLFIADAVVVWKGSVRVGRAESSEVYGAFHTLVLSVEDGETGVQLTSAEDDTQFVLVGQVLYGVIFSALLL